MNFFCCSFVCLCWVNGDVTQLVQVHWLREPNCSHISHPLSCTSRHTNSSCSQRCPMLYCFYIALKSLNLQDICDASAGCSYSYFESKGLHKWKLHSTHPLHWPKRLKFWKVQCYSPISASCKVNTGISKTYLCPISECIILSSWKYFFFSWFIWHFITCNYFCLFSSSRKKRNSFYCLVCLLQVDSQWTLDVGKK